MPAADYGQNVFVNCPFDAAYKTLFEAIVFAVHDCGFIARCALEVDDGSQVRIDKIGAIIAASRFGIHDISRTDADSATGLPRFNMPLELGLFLGAKRYGRAEQKQKSCLILDVDRYRFQQFISDIAGQDIAAHGGDAKRAMKAVRDWLSSASPGVVIPGGAVIASRYDWFRIELPAMADRLQLDMDALTFNDYVMLVEEWLKQKAAT